jgi:hypothetical protein
MDPVNLLALERVIRLHSDLAGLIGFCLLVGGAYWKYALLPYRGQGHDAILTPGHVSRPPVPGVLEQYEPWGWAGDSVPMEEDLVARREST